MNPTAARTTARQTFVLGALVWLVFLAIEISGFWWNPNAMPSPVLVIYSSLANTLSLGAGVLIALGVVLALYARNATRVRD